VNKAITVGVVTEVGRYQEKSEKSKGAKVKTIWLREMADQEKKT